MSDLTIKLFGIDEMNRALEMLAAETKETRFSIITKVAQGYVKGAIRATKKAKKKDIKAVNKKELKKRKLAVGHAKAGWFKAYDGLNMTSNHGIPNPVIKKYSHQGKFIDRRFAKKPYVIIGNGVWYITRIDGTLKKVNRILKRQQSILVRECEKKYNRKLKKHIG